MDLWLACYTQEEIAEREEITQQAVDKILQQTAELPKVVKPIAEHLVDFEVPLYNVWKYRGKSEGSAYPGNTEPTIVDNLQDSKILDSHRGFLKLNKDRNGLTLSVILRAGYLCDPGTSLIISYGR